MDDPLDPGAFQPQSFEGWDGSPPPYPPGDDPAASPPLPPPFGLEEGAATALEPTAADADGTTLDALAGAIAGLEATVAAGVASLLGEFRDKLALDRFKEDQITRLHDELQAYRNDLISRASRQILQGVIRLHDNLGKVVASLRKRPAEELTPERFFQQLAGFQEDVELLLDQHGVEKFEVEGEEFDPRRQTAVSLPTDDPGQVGRVAERLRPGFLQGETLLQKERVAVYATANAKG